MRLSRTCSLLLLLGGCLIPTVQARHPTSARAERAIERVTPELQAALARRGLTLGRPILVRIFKTSGELEVWVQKRDTFALFKTYDICSFSGTLGPKQRVGDEQSPEGFYQVAARQLNPHSLYHLSFDLGYPNAYDRAHGRTGSALMVHGACESIGCYAMTNTGIEEIYTLADAALRQGQTAFQVQAFPFRMTKRNLAHHRGSPWLSFWQNLRQGYRYFQRQRVPPKVGVSDASYVFHPAARAEHRTH